MTDLHWTSRRREYEQLSAQSDTECTQGHTFSVVFPGSPNHDLGDCECHASQTELQLSGNKTVSSSWLTVSLYEHKHQLADENVSLQEIVTWHKMSSHALHATVQCYTDPACAVLWDLTALWITTFYNHPELAEFAYEDATFDRCRHVIFKLW